MRESDKDIIKGHIDSILDIKEKIVSLQYDLEGEKQELFNFMIENNINNFNSEIGSAKIIRYSREGLKKDEVLTTFERVNKGIQNGRINLMEHIKISPVAFVLVKGID